MSDHITQLPLFPSLPHFPDNLEDYAPWVAKHGLRFPYGECQCGCGQKTRIAPYGYAARQWVKGKPERFFSGHNYRMTFAERFWGMADASDGPDACWHWKGYIHKNGYGSLPPTLAHRASWEINRGPIPDGLQVCHKCDANYPPGDITYRRCVNPAHLFLGTQSDNLRDMVRKGRFGASRTGKGEKNPRAVLTEQTVRLIREKFDSGMRQADIARELGLTRDLVGGIVRRRSWTHI